MAVWMILDEYWDSPIFKNRSKARKKAHKNVEVTGCTGAKPFGQKRVEMEAEKKEPITALEFANAVYKFDKPGEQAFKDKLTEVQSSQAQLALEATPSEPPLSPRSQNKRHQKNELLKIIKGRPTKKGKSLMYPWNTIGEVLGVQRAGELINSQSSQNLNAGVQVPESVYFIFPRPLTEVSQMVISIPMREVTKAQLDENICNLADVAFPDKNDPIQQSMWSQYLRAAESCLDHILATNNKSEPVLWNDQAGGNKSGKDHAGGNNSGKDQAGGNNSGKD